MFPPMLDPLTTDGTEPGCAACAAAVKAPTTAAITWAQCPGCAARHIAQGQTAWRVLTERSGPHELRDAIAQAFAPAHRATARKKVWHWWELMRRHAEPTSAATPAPAPPTPEDPHD